MPEEKKTPAKTSTRNVDLPEGDPEAEPGTPEHLGSDRPYEGGEWHGDVEPK